MKIGGEKILKKIDIPVVIMAGGKGVRWSPFTKLIPKPLIPIDETPVIEIIMDRFSRWGARSFYITLNYKGEMVKTYFDGNKKKYTINYLWEKDFLGTAGSLALLPSAIEDTFIVSNCDVIVKADYADLVHIHKKKKNILTIVGTVGHYKIPYGVMHFDKDGRLEKIQEKPEFNFTINAGVYVLSKKALSHIPRNSFFDMTDFMQILLDRGEKVGVYTVSKKSYTDIGNWEGYKRCIEKTV